MFGGGGRYAVAQLLALIPGRSLDYKAESFIGNRKQVKHTNHKIVTSVSCKSVKHNVGFTELVLWEGCGRI